MVEYKARALAKHVNDCGEFSPELKLCSPVKYSQRQLAAILGTNHTKLQRLARRYPEAAPAILEGSKKYYSASQVEILGSLLRDRRTRPEPPMADLFAEDAAPDRDNDLATIGQPDTDFDSGNGQIPPAGKLGTIEGTAAENDSGLTDKCRKVQTPAAMKELPKYQVNRRLMRLTLPADKFPKKLFNLNAEAFESLLAGAEGSYEEFKHKGKTIETPFWLKNVEGYLDKTPLKPFDREVLFVLISAYEEGFRVATYHTLLNALTGGNKNYGRDSQYEAVKAAVDKLRSINVTIDTTLIRKTSPRKYDNESVPVTISDCLLPCRLIEATYNGKKTLIIEMYAESPLMLLARDVKHQVQTYDLNALDVPQMRNTPLVIVIKHTLRRWVDGVVNRGLTPTIKLETFFESIGLVNSDKWKKQDARKLLADVMNHFAAENLIKSWVWSEGKGGEKAITIRL